MNKRQYLGFTPTQIKRRCFEKAESIEEMVRRSKASKEPIEAISDAIYTNSKDGVIADLNPRTDKQVLAVNEFDRATRQIIMTQGALQSIEEGQDPKDNNE